MTRGTQATTVSLHLRVHFFLDSCIIRKKLMCDHYSLANTCSMHPRSSAVSKRLGKWRWLREMDSQRWDLVATKPHWRQLRRRSALSPGYGSTHSRGSSCRGQPVPLKNEVQDKRPSRGLSPAKATNNPQKTKTESG